MIENDRFSCSDARQPYLTLRDHITILHTALNFESEHYLILLSSLLLVHSCRKFNTLHRKNNILQQTGFPRQIFWRPYLRRKVELHRKFFRRKSYPRKFIYLNIFFLIKK